jgi:oligopeptide transport system substrate-binding protein
MRLLIPFIVLALILFAAVSWDDTPREADLVFVNRGEVFTLDPQRMSYLQDFRMAYALYEGLVRWNNITLAIEPACAELPEISEDRRMYTFRIRPEARWSNGDPVTAHDFVYSWQRLLMPDTAADYSNLLFDIEGAEEFFRWRGEQLAEFAGPAEAGPAGAQHLFDHATRRFRGTVGVRALDDRTLQITLKRPVAYFLDLICFVVAYPVHRPTVEGWPKAHELIHAERGWIAAAEPQWSERELVSINPFTARLEQKHEWARPGRLVSNGPYVLAEWRYKRDLRLERNPRYHSPQNIKSDSVVMLSIEDVNTAVLAFESGKIDWLSDVGAEYQADMLAQRERYIARHQALFDSLIAQGMSVDESLAALPEPDSAEGERRDIHAYPTFGTDFFSFNCREYLADGRPNPFADARVRRAFTMAVDKHAIVRGATRMNEPVVNVLIPPGSIPKYQSPAGLPFDRQRALDELAAAGWRDRDNDGLIENERGEAFPVIDLLWTTNSARYKWISLELKAQWEAALGVRVELRGADTKFYKEDLKLGKYMIARGRWYGDYGDPTTFLDINRTGNGNNDRGFSDARFDALLDDAASEVDLDRRMRILEEAERYLMEEAVPLLPICQLVQTYMYEPGELKGLTSHPRLIQYLWQMEAHNGSDR